MRLLSDATKSGDKTRYTALTDDEKTIVENATTNTRAPIPTWNQYLERKAEIAQDRTKSNPDWLDMFNVKRARRRFGR